MMKVPFFAIKYPAKQILIAFLMFAGASLLRAQTLEDYVRISLESNLALKQEALSVSKATEALRSARGLFLPSVSLNARYSEMSGNILNLGDFVNPIYRTFNQFLQQNAFPTDIDVKLPQTQETKVSLVQPLYNPAIWDNYALRRHVRDAEEAGVESFRRQLVADVKTAYYSYGKALRATEIYSSAIALVEENLRVNERLVANDKATPDVVYRSRAELAEIRQKKAEAEQKAEAAQWYFNFLLNRDYSAPIVLRASADSVMGISQEAALNSARSRREEFRRLDAGIRVAETSEQLASDAYLPSLALAVDYGFQGNTYDFSLPKDYVVASLALQWNIFNGFQDDAKRQEAKIEIERLKMMKTETESKIILQTRIAFREADVAQKAIAVARERVFSSRKSFEFMSKKYAEGIVPLLAFLDARTELTAAELNVMLAEYDYLIKLAQLERAGAFYRFE